MEAIIPGLVLAGVEAIGEVARAVAEHEARERAEGRGRRKSLGDMRPHLPHRSTTPPHRLPLLATPTQEGTAKTKEPSPDPNPEEEEDDPNPGDVTSKHVISLNKEVRTVPGLGKSRLSLSQKPRLSPMFVRSPSSLPRSPRRMEESPNQSPSLPQLYQIESSGSQSSRSLQQDRCTDSQVSRLPQPHRMFWQDYRSAHR